MEETSTKTFKRKLYFEKSGETIAIKIDLENISPQVEKETISAFLTILYEKILKDINRIY